MTETRTREWKAGDVVEIIHEGFGGRIYTEAYVVKQNGPKRVTLEDEHGAAHHQWHTRADQNAERYGWVYRNLTR